jgi:hypothetical protein
MKRIVLSTVCALMIASIAMADHIGIYPDATGSSCELAKGFSTTATIIEKFSIGTRGARFKIDLSLCPGTAIFNFVTNWGSVGNINNDMSVAYGQCLSGNVVVGTLTAVWAPGAVSIVQADLQPNIYYWDCNFLEQPATGGHASIDGDGHGCDADPVQPATWGGVKALYR